MTARTYAPDLTARRVTRLRPEAFTDDAITTYGWHSLHAGALACGVSPTNLGRALRREITPSATLIASLIHGTGRTFDQLFVVEDDTTA